MIRTIFILFLLSSSIHAAGQITNYFTQLSGSYFRFTDQEPFVEEELSIRTAVGFNLQENWRVGFKYQQVFYRRSKPNYTFMWLMGPFGRIHAGIKRWRFYGEAGIFFGNYCSCGLFEDSYRAKGLLYGSFGTGGEFQLMPQLYLEMGVIFHSILNRRKESVGYNGYLIGLILLLKKEHG